MEIFNMDKIMERIRYNEASLLDYVVGLASGAVFAVFGYVAVLVIFCL